MVGRFYTGVRGFVRPIVRLLWNPRVSGLENVPPEGGFVIASNHLANIDSFMIPVVLPRAIRFVAKESLWTQKGPHGAVLRWFFDAVGAVPVDREALSSGKGALQAGLEVLGLSLVTNAAAGISPEPLSHTEVIEAGRAASARCGELLAGIIPRL